MDTGSSLLWFPCTRRYSCNFADIDPADITTFITKSSSSAKILGCRNPKCKWIFPNLRCSQCGLNQTRTHCTQPCPPYIIQYGSGSTTGLLLSDSLVFPDKTLANFVAGCSIFSNRQPAGIAGFGRGPESLPAQMSLKKFSYCLVSHHFDGEPITVGGVKVKAPYKYLVPDSDGRGGTIVDSGTTFTYMEKEVFELVAEEFERQIGKKYGRAAVVEKESGLRPCYNISGEKAVDLPELTFQFKGGAKMALPLADYFSFLDESVICMTIVSSGGMEDGFGPGPAIILGNYQQQNFYIEYDLENERFRFRSQNSSFGVNRGDGTGGEADSSGDDSGQWLTAAAVAEPDGDGETAEAAGVRIDAMVEDLDRDDRDSSTPERRRRATTTVTARSHLVRERLTAENLTEAVLQITVEVIGDLRAVCSADDDVLRLPARCGF
ncbi:hypothetical protein SASPL_105495 [Salvia splendens]|uniref:Peptidase A1 domain-containing protein n=1 Tax=Salvia splendens TaxID=180675 RepID=A0A8X8YPL9_SALSN|nr:hypothetical protein SASPL_105495 [Salvia splendens]